MDRRKFLATTGTALGGLLAGCSGNSSTETTTEEQTTQTTEQHTQTTEDGSYSVSMAPVGEVTFDSVPQTWVANNGSWADMGVALGLDAPKAVWMTSRYHTDHYDDIPGVSVDTSKMTSLYQSGVAKETFYGLDQKHGVDVHVIDPNFLQNRFKGWEKADVEEIRTNVAPFFGNSIFSRSYGWHDSYQYYTLYEAFGKLAKLFQREERYEKFATLHDEFIGSVKERVPAESKRPSVAVLWPLSSEPEKFLPYLIDEGTSYKQWRDLGVKDALANTDVEDFHSSRGQVDYETLLQIDPDVLLLRGNEDKTAKEFEDSVVAFMKDHNVASELTAVKNGDVYRGGPLYQGPIQNLSLTERAARQVYPDEFGTDEKLYDRQRVADIVAGN